MKLLELVRAAGPVTFGTAAALCGTSQPRILAAADRLEQIGWVVRRNGMIVPLVRARAFEGRRRA